VSWSTPASDTKRLVANAYDRSSDGFAGAADRVVYRYLAQPLVDTLGTVQGAVLDVAAGAGAAGRQFDDTVALDLSLGQLRHNPARKRVRADAERLPFRADTFPAAVCVFGINHFPDPAAAVSEMAHVAPVVGLATWARPEPRYAPKTIVLNTLERHAGRCRSTMGEVVDSLADRVGSVAAVAGLLERAGLNAAVEPVTVTIPWPGIEAFLDYRLSMASTAGLVADEHAVRQEAAAALASLAEDELDWHAAVIVGVGQRR
jgi:ubiquinone/menaquinone biosynthesis C-methylase UbiE